MDNLGMHKGTDALLFALAHSGEEFMFQPKRAAYLNLTESCAFAGKSFESWEQSVELVSWVTSYWNVHCHPFIWGRR